MCKLSLPAALAAAQQYQQPQYLSQQQQSQLQHAQCKSFYLLVYTIFLRALLAWQSEDKYYYCINVIAHVTDEIRKGQKPFTKENVIELTFEKKWQQ